MTSSHLIDAEQLLADQLAQASPDLLRGLLSTFIAALMGAEADALCGAGYRERSDERSNQRNGYRHRDFDTRAATIDVAIPKLRQGSYFPDWLLQRRKRAERALTSVVATCYLLGVSTRRMERLVETLGVTKLSKSQVSIMAKELDEAVEAFRTRPLDAGPYTFLAADALVLKVREAGRVVGVHTLIATGVNAEGYREILGIQVTSAEDGAGWLAFFRDLVARGLSGVALVHQRRPRRPGGRDRRHPARSGLAALQNPLRSQSDGSHPEALLAVGAHPAALHLRPARRRISCCPI
ncbi:transposase [Mycobacterium tuberculosis TKK_03_0037]|nr:transposase [Mycobacterium tuberculosis TKK_03_0037]